MASFHVRKRTERNIEKAKEQTATLIFYESPYRITATLTNFLEIFEIAKSFCVGN